MARDVTDTVYLIPRGDTTTSWWVSGTAMTMVAVATVSGNVSVVGALWRLRRTPLHYPLISLVVADSLVGIAVLPIAAARELFVFHLPRFVCAFWSTMDVLCCTASILSLCALGWERWCGITTPLARAKRHRIARRLAYLVWPIATAVALPTAFIPSPRHFHPGELAKACTVNTNIGYVFFSITLSFYIPAVMMGVMYGFILKALATPPPVRMHRGRIANPEKQVRREQHMSRQKRATRTIIMLMALFLVCWTPFFVMLPIDSLFDCVSDTAWQWCTWLGYLNSSLNPIVYAAASPTVRRVIRASFSGRSSRNDLPMTPCARRT
ncbi:octopamine receptor-like [Leptidea sinapis]|uniref:octopamine receptor-like n=1 Tax=Leptidea sinapis TaxID=189913 RepID=UPI0021C478C4|nr:octopamine receptor-like [Leptidea sinapis]